jgi:ketosteroid isomerase-like protein
MQDATTNSSMHRSRRIALALMLISVFALAVFAEPPQKKLPRAQKHEIHHEINQLEETWRNAVLSGNIAAMDALLADDYMAITSSGTLQTKEQALATLRTGKMHITSLELTDRKVHFYGTTALVTSKAEVQATTAEGNISGSYRYVRVYARDARGAWKIVNFETSRIRESDEHK